MADTDAKIGLNVLDHMGLSYYCNTAAVVAEARTTRFHKSRQSNELEGTP